MKRPSHGTTVAYLALFTALGGGAYAASLPRNSVGTPQLKKSAVTSVKVRNKSLRAVDFAAGQLPRGDTGPQGSPGPNGPQGAQGVDGVKGETGAAGSAFAYAFVDENGNVDASRSKNVIDADTPSIGIYCLVVEGTPKNAVVSPEEGTGVGVIAGVSVLPGPVGGNCSATPGADAVVQTNEATNVANLNYAAFYVAFN
jgi:hypothetical protein